jgi:hypothetical protein
LVDGDDDRLDVLIAPTFSRSEMAHFFERLEKRMRVLLAAPVEIGLKAKGK